MDHIEKRLDMAEKIQAQWRAKRTSGEAMIHSKDGISRDLFKKIIYYIFLLFNYSLNIIYQKFNYYILSVTDSIYRSNKIPNFF